MGKHAAVIAPRRRRPKRALAGPAGDGAKWGQQYYLKAIGRALDVLECFPDESASLSLKEIGRLVRLPESSLFRVLLTLESRGYLEQAADGSYRLPRRIWNGRLYARAERFRECVRPHLQALARRFDETASTAYLYGDQVRVLDTVETFQEIRVINLPGRVLPPHCSSLGKAITAFQEPALIERMIEVYGLFRRTEKTIVDRQLLLEEYAAIRQQGFACDREETVAGGLCVGAPIFGGSGRVVAAISVSTPLVRMTPRREQEIRRAVQEAAARAANAAISSENESYG